MRAAPEAWERQDPFFAQAGEGRREEKAGARTSQLDRDALELVGPDLAHAVALCVDSDEYQAPWLDRVRCIDSYAFLLSGLTLLRREHDAHAQGASRAADAPAAAPDPPQ